MEPLCENKIKVQIPHTQMFIFNRKTYGNEIKDRTQICSLQQRYNKKNENLKKDLAG